MYFLAAYKRGIFNRYRKGMPWSEMMLKDLNAIIIMLTTLLKGKPLRRMLVYPHYPSRGSTIYRIARALDFEVTNKPSRPFDLAMYWEYATIREEFEVLQALADERSIDVINLQNRNIGKDVVAEWMQEAFGYSTKLNPTTYRGKAVKKSIKNAVHDGTLVDCPCDPEEGFVYMKFIDSSANDQEVVDLRIPVMGKQIPHLYLNYRNNAERFKNVPDRAELVLDIRSELTQEEEEQIVRFCELARMDFGELDVLRDCIDKRLYVVDANNTPQGPPKNLAKAEKKLSMKSYVKAFQEEFLGKG